MGSAAHSWVRTCVYMAAVVSGDHENTRLIGWKCQEKVKSLSQLKSITEERMQMNVL